MNALVTKEQAEMAVELAKKYCNNESAVICLNDATSLLNKGNFFYSVKRASSSLLYSVGCFSEAFRKVDSILHPSAE